MDHYPQHVRNWIARRGGLSGQMVYLNGRELSSMYASCGSLAGEGQRGASPPRLSVALRASRSLHGRERMHGAVKTAPIQSVGQHTKRGGRGTRIRAFKPRLLFWLTPAMSTAPASIQPAWRTADSDSSAGTTAAGSSLRSTRQDEHHACADPWLPIV